MPWCRRSDASMPAGQELAADLIQFNTANERIRVLKEKHESAAPKNSTFMLFHEPSELFDVEVG